MYFLLLLKNLWLIQEYVNWTNFIAETDDISEDQIKLYNSFMTVNLEKLLTSVSEILMY